MKVKQEYVVCDVCSKECYGEDASTEVTFTYNGKDHKMDSCYYCISTRSGLEWAYKKIAEMIKGKK